MNVENLVIGVSWIMLGVVMIVTAFSLPLLPVSNGLWGSLVHALGAMFLVGGLLRVSKAFQ